MVQGELHDDRPEIRGEGQLLQAMLAHWMHEDNLYWTQIRHLLVLQLAINAAGFTVGATPLGLILMLLGALLSAFFYRLATKIQENRDANLDAIAVVSVSLASRETGTGIARARSADAIPSWGLFRFAQHPLGVKADAGKRFHAVLFIGCIVINILVALAFLQAITCNDPWLRYIHPELLRPPGNDGASKRPVGATAPNPAPRSSTQNARW
jgi:hypothetical protein